VSAYDTGAFTVLIYTERPMIKFAVVLSLVGSLAGCGGKKEDKGTPAPSSAPAASNTGGSATTPSAPPAPADKPAAVDVCGLLPTDKVEAVTGKVTGTPTPMQAQGSLLGGCDFMLETGMASVSARPVGELEATASMAKATAGADGVYKSEKTGAFVKLGDKPFFLQVLVAGTSGIDAAKSAELAKAYAAAK
jgi:hypothetical protein